MTFPNQLLLGAPVGTTAGWVLGQLAVSYAFDADLTLTTSGVNPQSTNNALQVTGTISAIRKLIVPLSFGQTYTVQNLTTGGFSIQIIGPSGTGVLVPNGATITVVCDGTNFIPQSGGTTTNLVWAPGGTAGPNVFTTWATLYAAISALPIGTFYTVTVSTTHGAATVPAGTYHLGTGKFIGQTGWELLTGASGAVADFLNLTFENFGNIIGVAGGGGIHSNGNFLEGDAGSSGLATITFRSCLIQNLSGAGATLIDGGAAVSCVFDNSAVVGANAVFSNPNGNGLSLTAVNQSQVPITAQGTAGQVQWDPTSIVTPASTWLASTGAGFTSTGVAVVIRIPIALITVLSIANIPAGAIVLRAFLDVTTPYSGGTTIELGTAANASLFMTTAQNTPTSANLYDKPQDTVNTTADPLLVTIAGGPGAGAGFACVEYCIPLT